MKLFTSNRERRLWYCTIAVITAVYATLGLMPTLSNVLRDRELIDGIFGLGMFLIVAAILIQSFIKRRGTLELGVLLGVIAVYAMLFARMALPEERTHLIEYSVVALLIHEALKERAVNGSLMWSPAIVAIIATAVVGIVDELIQGILPNRVFDIRDILFNVLAAVLAVLADYLLNWLRKIGKRNN